MIFPVVKPQPSRWRQISLRTLILFTLTTGTLSGIYGPTVLDYCRDILSAKVNTTPTRTTPVQGLIRTGGIGTPFGNKSYISEIQMGLPVDLLRDRTPPYPGPIEQGMKADELERQQRWERVRAEADEFLN